MKSRFATALAALALAGHAAAFNLAPRGSFTGQGALHIYETVGPNISCGLDLVGAVDAKGVATVTSLTTTCPNAIQATGLPWYVRPTSMARARFPAASFNVPVLGSCGPALVPLDLTAPGNFTMKITHMASGVPGSCKVWGNFTTTPALTISP